MPLLDHFHPPLSRRRHWDSFHGAWAEAMARQLNAGLLPPHYVAEARVCIGGRMEIDVGTFTESESEASAPGGDTAVAVWAPPRPVIAAPVDFGALDVVEVQVYNDEEGQRLVAAVELVSPANKDRPSHRRMFVVKCASYLQEGVGLAVVDVVTQRRAKLHADLLKTLGVTASGPVGTSCSPRRIALSRPATPSTSKPGPRSWQSARTCRRCRCGSSRILQCRLSWRRPVSKRAWPGALMPNDRVRRPGRRCGGREIPQFPVDTRSPASLH